MRGDEEADTRQSPEEDEHDEHGAESTGDPEPLEAIHPGREHDAEEHAEESDEDDRPTDPEKLEGDVNRGHDGGRTQDVPRPPTGCAVLGRRTHERSWIGPARGTVMPVTLPSEMRSQSRTSQRVASR